MGWNGDDVYYSPESFGLEQIGSLDDPNASWSFDYLIVWKHEDGRLFWATDSGCSCPSPFEDYTTLESLTPLTDEAWPEFQAAVEGHALPYHWDDSKPVPVDPQAADKTELLAKVAGLLG